MGNDKQVLQQIALYKAMNDGDLQVQADIRAGRLHEDELYQYLAQGYDAEDLHVFKRNIKRLMDDATNSQEKTVRLVDGFEVESEWNEEDGMSESIMSDFEDKEYVNRIKGGKKTEERDQEKTSGLSVVRIVQNIDELSDRVLTMKLTKIDFIDCLR